MRKLMLLGVMILALSACVREAGPGAYQPPADQGGATLPVETPTTEEIGVTLVAPTETETPFVPQAVETDTPDVAPTATTEELPTETPGFLMPTATTMELPPTATDEESVSGLGSSGAEGTATNTFAPMPTQQGFFPITVIAPTATPTTAGTPGATQSSGGSGLPPTPTNLSPSLGEGCEYIVQPGNTLFRIAINNNITLEELRAANPQVVGDLIQPGQTLLIPGCGEGLNAGEEIAEGTPDDDQPVPSVTGTPARTHTVARGETLISIARRYNVTVQDIVRANNLSNPNLLTPGQTLIIP